MRQTLVHRPARRTACRGALSAVLGLALVWPGAGAFAARRPGQLRPRFLIPAPPTAELRGPLGAPGQAVLRPRIALAPISPLPHLPEAAPSPPQPWPAPTALAAGGLRPLGEAAPICRADCAKARLTCESLGADSCGASWAVCVADCSAVAQNLQTPRSGLTLSPKRVY